MLFMIGGGLFGLIAACGVLVFGAITNRTFLSEDSLERVLGLPVLGSMPLWERNQQWLE
jgi:capsular polysaccharide biosynthesis protein